MPTTSSIHSSVSIEHRLVTFVTDTDRQTDTGTRAGENDPSTVTDWCSSRQWLSTLSAQIIVIAIF